MLCKNLVTHKTKLKCGKVKIDTKICQALFDGMMILNEKVLNKSCLILTFTRQYILDLHPDLGTLYKRKKIYIFFARVGIKSTSTKRHNHYKNFYNLYS